MKRTFILSLIMAAFTTVLYGQSAGKKALVVYYSYSGNTRVVAKQIQKETGADIFQIETVKAYPAEYKAVVDQAKKEINENYKPALKDLPANLAQYDVIYVGSPCWWGTVAPPVATFLSNSNLSGKTIAPFMTHGGSRMGHSVEDIKKLCPQSTVTEGLPIRGGQVNKAQDEVKKWLQKNQLIQ